MTTYWYINPNNPAGGAMRCPSPPFTQRVSEEQLSLLTKPETVADAIAQVHTLINQQADELRSQVLAGSSEVERAAWPAKAKEAADYLAADGDDESVAPLLKLEAITGGIALHDLAATVNAKATVFYGLEAQIAGTKRKHLDAIAALTGIDAVLNYDFSSGWPEID
ncbi:hypothetical protein SPB21_02640 [Leptothoe sp. ISB3NOV94-8A]